MVSNNQIYYMLVYLCECFNKSDHNKVLDRGGQTQKKQLDKEKLDIIVSATRYTKFTPSFPHIILYGHNGVKCLKLFFVTCDFNIFILCLFFNRKSIYILELLKLLTLDFFIKFITKHRKKWKNVWLFNSHSKIKHL